MVQKSYDRHVSPRVRCGFRWVIESWLLYGSVVAPESEYGKAIVGLMSRGSCMAMVRFLLGYGAVLVGTLNHGPLVILLQPN